MRVVIEGMDGSGKSSVAEELAKKTGYVHYTQKLIDKIGLDDKSFNELKKYVRRSRNPYMSGMFYALRCMIDNDEDENTIIERGILSMYYFEKDNLGDDMFSALIKLNLTPDLTFILYAPKEVRMERIKERNPHDPDLKSAEALSDGYDVMIDFARRFDIPYIGIDTTGRTKEQIVCICQCLIEGYEKTPDNKKKEYIERMNDIYGFDNLYERGGKTKCKRNTTSS